MAEVAALALKIDASQANQGLDQFDNRVKSTVANTQVATRQLASTLGTVNTSTAKTVQAATQLSTSFGTEVPSAIGRMRQSFSTASQFLLGFFQGARQGWTDFRTGTQRSGQASGELADKLEHDTHRARNSADLLTDAFGVRMPRELRKVIAESQLIGPALAAAFNVFAVVGFIQVMLQIPDAIKNATNYLMGYTKEVQKAEEEQIKFNQAVVQHKDEMDKLREANREIGAEGSTLREVQRRNAEAHLAELKHELEVTQGVLKVEQERAKTSATQTFKVDMGGGIGSAISSGMTALGRKLGGYISDTPATTQAREDIEKRTKVVQEQQLAIQKAEQELANFGKTADVTAKKELDQTFKKSAAAAETLRARIAALRTSFESLDDSFTHETDQGDPWQQRIDSLEHYRHELEKFVANSLTPDDVLRKIPGMMKQIEKAIDGELLKRKQAGGFDTSLAGTTFFGTTEEWRALAIKNTKAFIDGWSTTMDTATLAKAKRSAVLGGAITDQNPTQFMDEKQKNIYQFEHRNDQSGFSADSLGRSMQPFGAMQRFTDALGESVGSLNSQFENLFTGIAQGTRSAGDVFKGFADIVVGMIERMVMKMTVMYLLEQAMGWLQNALSPKVDVGSAGPNSSIPLFTSAQGATQSSVGQIPFGHAIGGPFEAGQPVTLEHSAIGETVVFNQPGHVLRADQQAGSGGVQVNINNYGQEKKARALNRYDPTAKQIVTDVILQDLESNGPIRHAMGGR